MKRTLVQLGLVAAIISTLVGCGGGGGSDGVPGATGATGATGVTTGGSITMPAGSAVVSTSNAVAFAPNSTPATSESTAAWKALAPTVSVTSVSIQSPPVVKFTVTDANGKAVIGLGSKTQASTARVASYANLGFTLAKLVPGTNGSPSKWVSYNILKPGTVAQRATGYTQAATESCTPDFLWCGTYPAADKEGTLIDNGDGSYQYTFYRDPKLVKDLAATLVDSADGLSKKADLGDLTFDATATHRLGILISGNAPGSGTNTPTAVASAAAPTAVAMVIPGNQWFDFRPDGQAVTATRQVVNINSCASCHDGKVIGHSDRRDPNLCVTCHTDQVKYSFDNVALNNGEAPSTNNGLTLTGGVTGTTQQKRAEQAIVGGRAVGNYPNMAHKIHMGDELTIQGYNFNANGGAMLFNANGFPQDRRNCTKCHNGDTPANALQAVKTADGNNWKNVPSRLACGACHDGINFATGLGTTSAGATTGHGLNGVGGAQANDSGCVTCHSAAAIELVHRTNLPTANNPNVPAGVATITYEIKSVALNSLRQPVITFRIKKDGVAVTSFTAPTTAQITAGTAVNNKGVPSVASTFQPISGFTSGPTFYIAYAVPQDGITTPADFNTYQSVSLANLLVTSGTPKAGTIAPAAAAADAAAGYFDATLTGDLVGIAASTACPQPLDTYSNSAIAGNCVNPSPIVIPTTAKLITGAMIGTFTQVGVVQRNGTTANVVIKSMIAKAPLSTSDARRVSVAVDKCNSCHDQLGGTVTTFHGGARNDPTACAICHSTVRTSSGWSANASTFIHGIHGKSKRTTSFNWPNSATSAYTFTTPGVLQDCGQCHVPNAVNLGSLGATPLANLLWSSTATNGISSYLAASSTKPVTNAGDLTALPAATTYPSPFANTTNYLSPYVTAGTNYGNNFNFVPAGAVVAAYYDASGTKVAAHVAAAGGEIVPSSPATLVSSPISAACYSCHDTAAAKGHMSGYGGYLYVARSVVGAANLKSNPETCLICHGQGKVNDAAVIHHK